MLFGGFGLTGKVVRRRFLLPKLSMVQNAGRAKRKLMTPKPREAHSADISLKLAARKISVE